MQKGALRSKAVWGAILTLLGAAGLTVFGIEFDAERGGIFIPLDGIVEIASASAIAVGGPLSLIGRLVAKSPIRGLW